MLFISPISRSWQHVKITGHEYSKSHAIFCVLSLACKNAKIKGTKNLAAKIEGFTVSRMQENLQAYSSTPISQ